MARNRVWKGGGGVGGGGHNPAFPLFFTTIPHPKLLSSVSRILPAEYRFLSKSRIPCQNFGESRFLGSSQIPYPVKNFCVFRNPVLYLGQIPETENIWEFLCFPATWNPRVTLKVLIKVTSYFKFSFCFQIKITYCSLLQVPHLLVNKLEWCQVELD